jgi:hypothetical protein
VSAYGWSLRKRLSIKLCPHVLAISCWCGHDCSNRASQITETAKEQSMQSISKREWSYHKRGLTVMRSPGFESFRRLYARGFFPSAGWFHGGQQIHTVASCGTAPLDSVQRETVLNLLRSPARPAPLRYLKVSGHGKFRYQTGAKSLIDEDACPMFNLFAGKVHNRARAVCTFAVYTPTH